MLVRGLAAALSLAVLVPLAVAWVHVQQLHRSTPAASVIDGPPPAPAAEQNILLVGLDSRTDAAGNPLPRPVLDALRAGDLSAGGNTTDTMIVVHVPAGGGRASAISIPRDAYVDVGAGEGKHKINSAYTRAYDAALARTAGGGNGAAALSARSGGGPSPGDPAAVRSASAAGARATIGAVEELTGLRIDHYAAVNLAGFADLSAAVGGVPVCLRAAVDDPYAGVALAAGPQEVSGAGALAFVRQRRGLPGGDLDRIARQQAFLAGATGRLLSAGTLADPAALGRLTDAASRAVTLDAGWDVLAFARQMQGLSAGAVTFRTIPTGSASLETGDGTAVAVDPEEVRSFVAGVVAADAVPPTVTAPVDRVVETAPSTVPTTTASSEESGGESGDKSGGDGDESGGDGDESGGDGDDADPGSDDAATPVTPVAPAPAPITAAAPGCVN